MLNKVLSFCVVLRLRTWRPRKRGSISTRSKKFFSSPKRPYRLCGQPSHLFGDYWGKAAGAWSWTLTSICPLSEAYEELDLYSPLRLYVLPKHVIVRVKTSAALVTGAHPSGGGGQPHCSPPNPSKPKLKKNRFCRYYGIESFTWFTLQLKSATKIGWWLVR
jgi:hypothetical protein